MAVSLLQGEVEYMLEIYSSLSLDLSVGHVMNITMWIVSILLGPGAHVAYIVVKSWSL